MRTSLPILLTALLLSSACELGDDGAGSDELPDPIALPGAGGYIHLYQLSSYGGIHIRFPDANGVYGSGNLAHQGFDNKLTSFVNRMDGYWLIARFTESNTRLACIRPRSHVANMANANCFNDDGNCNNLTSSIYWLGPDSGGDCTNLPKIGAAN